MEGEKEVAGRIIDGCLVGESHRIYSIGSFGRFVNFAAQQYRSLNLIWALNTLDRLPSDGPIAVVGGGLSGITAATALVRLGRTVDLYERQKELMAHQLTTDHRLVHPTINQWPLQPLIPATNFPFLNWVSGPCTKVISGLLRETEDLQKENQSTFSIVRNRKISDLDVGINGILLGTPGRAINKAYSAVIIAVGHGDERHHEKFPATSYWYPDGIEHETLVGEVEYFFVSGCGDGGLIDGLRILHRDFDKGGLIFETANSLEGSEAARRIGEVERTPHAASKLEQVYVEVAREIANDPSLRDVHDALSYSVGQCRPLLRLSAKNGENPFATRAAPIHKLMIAHAMHLNKVVYRKAEIDLTETSVVLGGKAYPRGKRSRVIIRHGPIGPPLEGLLSSDQVDDLRAKQEGIESILAQRCWNGDYPTLHPENRVDKILKLHRQAARAIKLLNPLAFVAATETGYEIALADGSSDTKFPTEIFGIPVHVTKVKVATAL